MEEKTERQTQQQPRARFYLTLGRAMDDDFGRRAHRLLSLFLPLVFSVYLFINVSASHKRTIHSKSYS